MDFALNKYKELISTFLENDYQFLTFQEFLNKTFKKAVILRHDIDKLPNNSLKVAEIENNFHVNSTNYFRTVPRVFKKNIIEKLMSLGHEIGYHYEDISLAKGDYKQAIKSFTSNLSKLRELYPIKTICMHGSPLSKYDNRDLWKKYDYRDYGIIGEPYFDIDFNEVLYLTDTGRCWNASRRNIRDKVQSKYNYNFKSTSDIICALAKNELPDKIMLNVHPQRWNDKFIPWAKELVWQNIKNVAKKSFFNS